MRSLAALVLVTQLGAVAHVALVQHAVCLEHGESIHVAHRSAAAPVGLNSTEAAVAHEHEHCAVCANRRASSPPEASLAVCALSPRPAEATPPSDAPRPAREAVYRRAPKSSP